MHKIGPVETKIYKLRSEHPLIIPQIDPDKHSIESAVEWFKNVKNLGLSHVVLGGSIVEPPQMQELLDIAIKDFDFTIASYITNSTISTLKGGSNRTAVYWMQVPNSQNTFYGWDGLIAMSLNIEKSSLEPIPTVYTFDDRGSIGTSNWVTRAISIPKEKPEVSLSLGKAAEFFGVRFYIMAGGSGSIAPPPIVHVNLLTKNTNLFVIPTSGINLPEHADKLFNAGADALHIGNRLEQPRGFKVLNKMVKISNKYSGKDFI